MNQLCRIIDRVDFSHGYQQIKLITLTGAFFTKWIELLHVI